MNLSSARNDDQDRLNIENELEQYFGTNDYMDDGFEDESARQNQTAMYAGDENAADLSIDDELKALQEAEGQKPKKPRKQTPKLTAEQLTSDQGLQYLRHTGPRIQFKGKGNEGYDLGKLILFYKKWGNTIAPQFTFEKFMATAMKECRTKKMRAYLSGMIRHEQASDISIEIDEKSIASSEDEFVAVQSRPQNHDDDDDGLGNFVSYSSDKQETSSTVSSETEDPIKDMDASNQLERSRGHLVISDDDE